MRHAPPDLQALVAAHGGYEKIPRPAWEKHDSQVAAWRARIRRGGHYRKVDRPGSNYPLSAASFHGQPTTAGSLDIAEYDARQWERLK